MEELKFNVEEFHRGKWTPFMITDKDGKEVQKHVRITQEQADWNNKLQDAYKLRYVKDGAKPKKESKPKAVKETTESGDDIKSLRAEYKAKFNKNAFNGWDAQQIKERLEANV